jgi:tRNA(Ile)-lysidine synthase TilS/MesJ
MELEKVLAMAVAAVAEENKTDVKRVVVRSFREVYKSSLEEYIEKNNITYHKYQLEDSKA